MCITILLLGFTAAQIGYKDRIFIGQGEGPKADGSFSWSNTLIETPGVRAHNYVETLIYSEPHYSVLARCVEGTRKDWKVVNTATLTEEDKQTILDKVEAAGFRRDLARDMTSFCPFNEERIPSRAEVAQQVLDAFENQYVSLNIQSKVLIQVGSKVYNNVEEAFKALAQSSK